MKVIVFAAAIASVSLTTVGAIEHDAVGSLAPGLVRNEAPRVSALSARIGRVYDEAAARFRARGLSIRFRLCDDGPQSTSRRTGFIRLDHRWGDGTHTWFAARELAPLMTWDVHFTTPQCVDSVPWSSTLPADLPHLRAFPCYIVLVQVRDPAGRWSNPARVRIKKCAR
jgi:hypothetical protein